MRIVLLIIALLFLSTSYAQKYDSVLQILDSRYPQEKVYLHYDKSFYNPGETIWFKAYLFMANVPSQISKTLYADLLDENGKVIERRTAPVVMSSASAAFDLPASLTSPVVYVRVYTDWMLNFDTSFIYQKPVPIVQVENKASKPAAPKSFLQFFPESGDLVSGVESRVAFKATDVHGLPYKVSGNIVDSKGKTITTFSSVHDGMGFFMLAPDAKEKYKAVWKDAAGKTQQTSLPTAKDDGVVLRLEQDAAGINFTLSRPETGSAHGGIVQIVGQMQQQLVYLANGNLSKSATVRGNIPVENIPAGIIQVTVFGGKNKPLAERIVFINKPDYYFITDLNSALKGTDKRKKNVLQIDVPDTLRTNLSVSVTDADINPQQKGEEDIFSNVLLTSDIKGYVHNPGYYFSSEADTVIAHLDLVMMTNGWRRFKWEEVLAGKFPQIKYLPGDYITLKGQVNGLTKSQLTGKELTGILEIDKKQDFLNIPVEPNGTFSVPGLIFFDTAKLYYQFNNDKDKVLTSRAGFDVKNNLSKSLVPFKADTSSLFRLTLPNQSVLAKNKDLADKNIAVLDARRKVQTLQAVTVTGRQKSKKEIMDEEYTSGMFSGGDGYTFVMDDDISAKGALSVLQYLQGRVAGLQISGTGPQVSMSWRGGSPTLFLNEMQSDVNTIQNLSMADIAMVKVFRPPFYGAPGGGSGGAIAVYTRKGAAVNNADVKGLDFAKIPGYSPTKEFYSPDYSKYDERHSDADYRSTLYWEPFFLTDKDTRRRTLTFYNNDVTRRFRVVIEGCNELGQLTRIEKIFE
jgi:hypothetical protein